MPSFFEEKKFLKKLKFLVTKLKQASLISVRG